MADPRHAADRLAALEAAYLAARDARDRLDVAQASGRPADPSQLETAAAETEAAVRAAYAGLAADAGARAALGDEDTRALDAIGRGIEAAFGPDAELPVAPSIERSACDDADAWSEAIAAGGTDLQRRLEGCYGAVADGLDVGGERLARLQVLARLAREPDPAARRRLFLALEPLWRTVDGDGGSGGAPTPYGALLRESRVRWADGHSPIAANERALGLEPGDVERWVTRTLEAWRDAVVAPAAARDEPPMEPWDWWWLAGEAERSLDPALPLERVLDRNRRVYASLGADLDALRVDLDTTPRPGRPTLSVAFTTFGARPHRRPDGAWDPGRPTVFANYVDGGLGELNELVHETGHAVHIAGIRTRPAFADWPDSDALTEALAEIVTQDVGDPAWNAQWIPSAPAIPAATAARCRFAQVALDSAWSLFEIRVHAEPGRSPNEVWTAITSAYLGIAPHPEWSWWAMRGQLVQEPGYMANYGVGAVLAADLRAAIRAARGDWIGGDPGWYDWMTERVYRFGQERSAGAVLRDVLGRAPKEDALLAEIGRARD
jgi:hypothetical protein